MSYVLGAAPKPAAMTSLRTPFSAPSPFMPARPPTTSTASAPPVLRPTAQGLVVTTSPGTTANVTTGVTETSGGEVSVEETQAQGNQAAAAAADATAPKKPNLLMYGGIAALAALRFLK